MNCDPAPRRPPLHACIMHTEYSPGQTAHNVVYRISLAFAFHYLRRGAATVLLRRSLKARQLTKAKSQRSCHHPSRVGPFACCEDPLGVVYSLILGC